MLKTGICSLEEFNSSKHLKNIFGDDKEVSVTLYDQVQILSDADELAERILLLFKDARGVYKRTYAKRFDYFDNLLLNYVRRYFNLEDNLIIFDAAVSDGRTSVELFDKVTQIFKNIKYIASDYNNLYYILSKNNYKTKVTIDQNAKVLEILWPPFVFNKLRFNRFLFFYPLNYIINFIIYIFVAVPLIKSYRRGTLVGKELLLFAPKVLQKAKEDPRFILSQHDLTTPFIGTANLIRAMNVLNPSYFSSCGLRSIIKNIYNGLKDGGLFVVGSNQNVGSLVDGGIYQKNINGFELLESFGKGCNISSFIEKFDKCEASY